MLAKIYYNFIFLIVLFFFPVSCWGRQSQLASVKGIAISQLHISSIILQNDLKINNEATYNVSLERTTSSQKYQVTVGISYISRYFDPNSLDFAVTTSNYDCSFVIFFAINSLASWSSAHIHYIATSRNDIRVGQFIADSQELQSSSNTSIYNNQSLSISYNFAKRKWNGGSSYVFLYAYLSGITCPDRFMQISISAAYVDLKYSNIYINVTVSSLTTIQSLHLSYVMFTDANTPLTISLMTNPFEVQQASSASHRENLFIAIYSINAKSVSGFFSLANTYSSDPPNRQNRLLTKMLSSTTLQSFSNTFKLHGFRISSKEYRNGPILVKKTGGLSFSIHGNPV